MACIDCLESSFLQQQAGPHIPTLDSMDSPCTPEGQGRGCFLLHGAGSQQQQYASAHTIVPCDAGRASRSLQEGADVLQEHPINAMAEQLQRAVTISRPAHKREQTARTPASQARCVQCQQHEQVRPHARVLHPQHRVRHASMPQHLSSTPNTLPAICSAVCCCAPAAGLARSAAPWAQQGTQRTPQTQQHRTRRTAWAQEQDKLWQQQSRSSSSSNRV